MSEPKGAETPVEKPPGHQRLSVSINKAIQQSYLGKWALVGLFIGVIAGIGSTLFYESIQLVTNVMLGGIAGYYPPNPAGEGAALASVNPKFILIPLIAALGGLIAGGLVYNLAPEAEGHGTDEAIAAFHTKDGHIRRRIPIVKALASAFTIGSGGSGGREGPTAQIAAGFGSFVSDILHLPVRDKRIAVAVGIGAGIGSIFKSPFGGAILSAEILYSGGDFEAEVLLPAFVASPVGYVIFASFTGFMPIFGNPISSYAFTEPRNLLLYAMLGIACGLVGKLYTISFYGTKRLFNRLKLPKMFRPMIGAALSGVIAVFFPQVIGLGYGFLQFLISGNLTPIATNFFTLPLLATVLLLIVLKIAATSLTVGSGGSAGVFAPSLVIGGFVGMAFWIVANAAIPSWVPLAAPFVIVGMMALFAGVGRVPIAVILMVSEMTGTLSLLAPSMVAVVIAYFVTGPKRTIYRSQVLRRSESPAHRGEYSTPLMTKIYVVDAMNPNVVALSATDSVHTAQQLMLGKGFRGVPIVEADKLVGVVTMSDVQRVPKEAMGETPVSTVMTKAPVTTGTDETLLDAFNKMLIHQIGRLPVVSKDGRLLGIITRTDIIRTYDRALESLSKSEPAEADQDAADEERAASSAQRRRLAGNKGAKSSE